jgi:hypothetical protein
MPSITKKVNLMTRDESKLEILKKVESGILSVEEGSALLGIFDKAERQPVEPEIIDHPGEAFAEPVETPKVSGCWKAAWSMILLAGAVLTAFSAFWVYQGYMNKGFGWGFWLSWIPLVLGVFIMVGGWILLESPWMHVRIHSKEDKKDLNIVLSMPIPFGLARWVFKTFGVYMPEEVRKKGIPEMLDLIEGTLRNGEPFHVQVDDKDDGSKVEVIMAK